MPCATDTAVKTKKVSRTSLKGKIPKGLDSMVQTPSGEMELLDVWISYKNEPTVDFRNVLMKSLFDYIN